MSYFSEVMVDNPKAYFRLNESSGLPQDSSGNSLHMTVTHGSPTYSQTGAIVSDPTNTSILFNNGTADYFTSPHNSILNVGDVFSLEAWIKRTASGAGQDGVVTKDLSYGLYIDTDRVALGRPSLAITHTTNAIFTDTTSFHHLVATKNGSTVVFYFDGRTVATVNVAPQTYTDDVQGLQLGDESTGGSLLRGYADEVVVYSTELSPARVLAHYNAAFLPDSNIYFIPPIFRSRGG